MAFATSTALMAWSLLAACASPLVAQTIDFRRDIAPLLEQHCLRCHHGAEARGGLSLESRSAALQGGDSGSAIEPGDPDASYLVEQVTPSDGAAAMPQGAPPLETEAIATIRRWIAQGAAWPNEVTLKPPTLWSLQPLVRPPVPAGIEIERAGGRSKTFVQRNPIDAFIARRLRQSQLRAAPEADRRTLVRRLYLDLIGLPPSPDEIQAFVSSDETDAYQRLVDRLLASPHFGERWGRHWLDLARYGDSDGYLGDSERPHAWVYREWVIDAINDDLPFDRFSIEQLAGDLLEQPTASQRVATGFHRNTLRNTEAGVDRELYRTQEIVDRVNTTGMVWLGLTLGCAECHDHKNDPITQTEFYRFYAFFNNADEVGVTVKRTWELAEYETALRDWRPGWQQLVARLEPYEKDELPEEQRVAIRKTLDDDGGSGDGGSFDWKSIADGYRTDESGWDELKKEIDARLKSRPRPPNTKAPAFAERTKDRRETFVHVRGVYTRHGPLVQSGTPAALPPLRQLDESPDRLDLAHWLFQPDNPLTARVAANRIWQHLFGQGLVATTNDFGNEGARPTHPELLDWLADEYRRLGWSRKALIRTIVTSSAYRLSSSANAVEEQQQVGNHLLWRQNSFRVDAEIVRDLHLVAAGLLDRTVGRRGIRPPLPEFVTEVGRSVQWPESEGGKRYRRGMYIFFKRTVPYPMLTTFDAPDSTHSCSRRERSNTPLQALTLLNDLVFHECAEVLGQRMLAQHEDDLAAATDDLFLRCLARRPTPSERSALVDAHQDLLRLAQSNSPVDDATRDPSESAMIALARIVMNLDEFITRD